MGPLYEGEIRRFFYDQLGEDMMKLYSIDVNFEGSKAFVEFAEKLPTENLRNRVQSKFCGLRAHATLFIISVLCTRKSHELFQGYLFTLPLPFSLRLLLSSQSVSQSVSTTQYVLFSAFNSLHTSVYRVSTNPPSYLDSFLSNSVS